MQNELLLPVWKIWCCLRIYIKFGLLTLLSLFQKKNSKKGCTSGNFGSRIQVRELLHQFLLLQLFRLSTSVFPKEF